LLPCSSEGYHTIPRKIPFLERTFPTAGFYSRLFLLVCQSSFQAKRGRYDDNTWGKSSLAVLRALERVGVTIEVTGAEHIEQFDTPCVIIGNHMSLLETLVLPCIIQPVRKVTFIVKESLLHYPIFRHVMRSRNPIAVGRDNPRHDLRTVLEGGVDRLNRGISIIVFPQTTRTTSFDPAGFNSIGVKLAQKAGVPIIPAALLTDAWENGKYFKDLGKINPAKKVRFAFGEPIWVSGRGSAEHQAIIRFIGGKLEDWGR